MYSEMYGRNEHSKRGASLWRKRCKAHPITLNKKGIVSQQLAKREHCLLCSVLRCSWIFNLASFLQRFPLSSPLPAPILCPNRKRKNTLLHPSEGHFHQAHMSFNTAVSSKGFKRVHRFIQRLSYAGLHATYSKEWWAEIQHWSLLFKSFLNRSPPLQTLCHV